MTEDLANWLRVALLVVDVEDRITLSDVLDRLGVLPAETWMTIQTKHLGADALEELTAAVRDVAGRNPHLGGALSNWERLHHCSFGERE